MTEILKFLNTNSGALSVLFSLVVTVATVFYAVLTHRLVIETSQMRRAQTEPHVAVRVEPSDASVYTVLLIVENVGAGPAYKLRLSVDPDFALEKGQTLSQWGLFQHGMHYLAPGQQVRLFLALVKDQMEEIVREGGRFDFNVSVQYVTATGATLQHNYPIDFRHLIGVMERRSPLHDVSQHLKKLAASISKIERGWSKLKVDVHTYEDRVRDADLVEQQWSEAQHEAQHDQSSPGKPGARGGE